MSLAARQVSRGGVDLEVGARGGTTVTLAGVLREPDVGAWLIPLIDDVHAQAVGAGLAEVQLDIRRLTYGNASVWKCLVHWLKRVRGDGAARYRLHVLSDRNQRWQEIGMSALRVFGGDRLIVTF